MSLVLWVAAINDQRSPTEAALQLRVVWRVLDYRADEHGQSLLLVNGI